ncbi:MAG: AAA family ATPase [Deltaproteobacteria bacterium]|nr:AAA family ATPase [Deltaproteobacteria bacterium]
MILKSVHVENFKSIKDSTVFSIDENVTCLVGKNESGKTAILQAIAKLNPTDPALGRFDEMEYPRHQLNEYQESGEEANVLTTVWQLTDDDHIALKEVLGPVAQKTETIRITKGYDNKRSYSIAIDDAEVVQHLLDSHDLLTDERETLKDLETIAALRKSVDEIKDPSQRQRNLSVTLAAKFEKGTAIQVARDILDARLPKIAFFSEYLRMPGQVSVTELKNGIQNKPPREGQEVFLALLQMINRTVEDLEKMNQHEKLKADLEGASNRITRDIFKYWTQNRHLRVQFLFEQGMTGDPAPFNSGWVLRTRIENTRHGVTTPFDQRSAGFVWFFSFLVWFSQVKKQYGDKLIILLDEPGLSLHAKAQGDLLRYFEEQLASKHQVIYTTHSPFMIDPKNLLRARTVEDVYLEDKPGEPPITEPDLGTKVGDDVLSTDRDTVFPLQACLGYEISQTLFIGGHSLLVEGPSEILYFEWFKQKLKSLGRTSLDPRWTITPCGGIDKVPAFLSLFAGNKLHIAVVTDFAVGQKQKLRNIKESKLLRDGHVLTMDMYAGQAEADVEDLLGRMMYLDIVREAYEQDRKAWLPSKRPATAPERVVKEMEQFFNTLPANVPEFDHYIPSEWLLQKGLPYEPAGLEEALNRFETLFKDLNALL